MLAGRHSNVCPPRMIARAKKAVKRHGVGLTRPRPGRKAIGKCASILADAKTAGPSCYARVLRICLGAT